MIIASYNVKTGGFNSYRSTAPKPDKIELLQQAVKEINADFIGLIDTFRWSEIYSTDDLGELFGYKYVFCTNLGGEGLVSKSGITILSKTPVTKFEVVKLGTRNAVKSILDLEGKTVEIFTVYLDYRDENERLNQATSLVSLTKSTSTLLIGDFNAIPKREVFLIAPLWHLFRKIIPIKNRLLSIADNLFEAKVVKYIIESGFFEISRSKTFPSPLFLHIPFPLFKVDHIFSSRDLEAKNFQVKRGSLFNKASDHYPICEEVLVKN